VLGHPLLAAYSAFRSGHALNNRLLRAVVADRASYEIVSFEDASLAPPGFADLAPAW
jgi:UDP-3-O-[3-hydroxymyristoyl] N-acetylglucosamine deacetylase